MGPVYRMYVNCVQDHKVEVLSFSLILCAEGCCRAVLLCEVIVSQSVAESLGRQRFGVTASQLIHVWV